MGNRNLQSIEGIEYKPVNNIEEAFENFLLQEGITDTKPYLDELPPINEPSVLLGERPEMVQKSNNISTFLRGVFGKKNTIVQNKNIKLDNVGRASLLGGNTIATCENGVGTFGDVRATLEDGLNLTSQGKNWQMQNNLSVGYVADLKMTGGKQTPGIQPGVKLNAGTSFVTKPNRNTIIGVDVEGHVVALKPYNI